MDIARLSLFLRMQHQRQRKLLALVEVSFQGGKWILLVNRDGSFFWDVMMGGAATGDEDRQASSAREDESAAAAAAAAAAASAGGPGGRVRSPEQSGQLAEGCLRPRTPEYPTECTWPSYPTSFRLF